MAFYGFEAYTAFVEKSKLHFSVTPMAAVALLLAVCVCMRFRVSAETLQYITLIGLLALISAEDLKSRTIPNKYLIGCVGVRMLYGLALLAQGAFDLQRCGYYVTSGVGIWLALALFTLLFERVTGREGIGGGDVKLFAVCGLYLGFSGAMHVVLLSCIIALGMTALASLASPGSRSYSRTFPFGPAIALAFCLVALI